MISRISDNTRFDTIVGNLSPLQDRADSVVKQLSTQKKVNQPSDDPEGTKIILGLRAAGASIAQYKDNIVQASTWLKITANNLYGVTDFLSQIQGIVKNLDSTSTQGMITAADSIQAIGDQMLSLANAQLSGRHIFSGSMTDTEPFADGTSGYQGDALAMLINVGQNASIGYNITGDAVFTFTNKAGVVDDIFKNLENMKTILQDSGSTEADISTALASLNDATGHVQEQVEDNVIKVETMLANLDFADSHLTDLKNRVGSMLSDREDADTAQLAVEFQMRLLALNASYSVATKIEESSLLRFLQ